MTGQEELEGNDPRIGVFVCKCGTNIAGVIDTAAIAEYSRALDNVIIARESEYTCSSQAQVLIKADILENKLDRIVVCACSPHMHERIFRSLLKEAGINPYMLAIVNIREQCSWVHSNKLQATEKAKQLTAGGAGRARSLNPLHPDRQEIYEGVIIIGGGVAGITAALQLANSGKKVHVIERAPSIGGRMAQLSKTFPTMDCAPCILSPMMVDAESHENIALHTCSELKKIEGSPGRFSGTILSQSRGVSEHDCINCGKCEEECPVSVASEFDEGLVERKAIYKMFPQAVPGTYAIDRENCIDCRKCEKACPVNAVDVAEPESEHTIQAGSIVVAAGFDLYDISRLPQYNPQLDRVITGMQLERMMILQGAAGGALKASDGQRVKSVCFALCAGSRDENHKKYCSKVCCSYSVKQALLLKKTYPYMNVRVYYIDMRTAGKGFEELYVRAQSAGIDFIKGKVSDVLADTGDKQITVRSEDTMAGEILEEQFDLVVLANAMTPKSGSEGLAKILGIHTGPEGFMQEKHPKLSPVSTHRPGIFLAGGCAAPKDIHDSVTDARSAAARCIEFIGDGIKEIDPIKSYADSPGACTQCRACIEICPEGAISLGDPIAIDSMACTGCGACAPECPEDVLDIGHYTDSQITGEVSALCQNKQGQGLLALGFLDDRLSYSAFDLTGVDRLELPPELVTVRVPTSARIGERQILSALAEGADIILLFEEENSPLEAITKMRAEKASQALAEIGIEGARINVMPLLLPTYPVIPKGLTRALKNLAPLTAEERQKIADWLA